MKTISLTVSEKHKQFMDDNLIVVSVFFRQKIDNLMKNENKIKDKSL